MLLVMGERQLQLTRIVAAMFAYVFETTEAKSDVRTDVHRLRVATNNHVSPVSRLVKGKPCPIPREDLNFKVFRSRTGVGGASLNQRQKRLSLPGLGRFAFRPYAAEVVPSPLNVSSLLSELR